MFTDSGDEMTAVGLMKAGLDDYVVKSARQLPRLRASMKIATDYSLNRSALSEREHQLAAALAHRDVIVRELHHRVKNNLQTITSLLELRARSKGGELAAELEDLAARMRALAAVQLRIYESESLDRVDFASTLRDISSELVRVRGDGRINLVHDFAGRLDLDVGRATPLALLSYEFILNALKHAWPNERTGKMLIALKANGGKPEIRICDDGVGPLEGEVSKGVGSKLMRLLAAEARVVVDIHRQPSKGTAVTLRLQ
jgi:two-component sensor histidine kinase